MTLFMTELPVQDLARMISWYAEFLRLRVVLRDDPRGFALLEAPEGGRLALKRSTEVVRGPGRCRLIFQVDDLEAERARLIAAGVVVSLPTENDEEHYREVRLADPEGTPIMLFAWTDR